RDRLIALLVPGSAEAAAPKKGLFGSGEIHSKNMKSFGKWTEMWRRHSLPKADVPKKVPGENYRCLGKFRAQCTREALEKFIAEQETSDTLALLKSVNKYMNKSPYIVDPVNWGIPDYWATPSEFLMKDGDCEDYAIGKYVALKRLGVDISAMRLVILQDENLRAAHAVLAVEVEGVAYILDNQVDAVLADTQILHYRPVYSINESGWWLHRVSRFTKKRY
ncbi:MAG: transglutaminase-like cysteine peptidase, partial [Kordiimonadaceae bacterium]|nr:transglutaminase-like cysteine peptidase [Kordiimonadaceae bacterium]